MHSQWIYRILIFSCFALLASCQLRQNGSFAVEFPYCSTPQSFSSSNTITGRAVFQRRAFSNTGLGDVDSTLYPIRYAEIQVFRRRLLIQCGETDSSGNFSVQVPTHNEEFEIRVNSRADNTHLK